MTTGLARFYGERLREARLVRGLTATALAEQVDVSSASISQYERQDRQPRPAVLTALANALGVPEAFFFRAPLDETSAPHRFRSLAATTKSARSSVALRVKWLREMVGFLDQFVDLPPLDLPKVEVPSNPLDLEADDIEDIAAEVRRVWGLGVGPLPSVVGLLETHGVCVARFSFMAREIDGVSALALERPFVILNTEAASAVRSRFDAAHELGHLLMHQAAPANPTTDVHKKLEAQAHRFAGALLFPADSFRAEVYALHPDALEWNKRRWGCSMALMVRRARDLDMLSEDQYSHAMRRLSARGFRRREPLDDELPVEEPSMLSKAVRLVLEHGALTASELLHLLPFSPADLRLLLNVPPGLLSPPPEPEPDVHLAAQGRVVQFKPRGTPSRG